MSTALHSDSPVPDASNGEFLDFDGERFYVIDNVDRMPPFFISVVSNSDHWLFVSSTGGLSAGRVSPDTALFPYITDDKIHESTLHTGPRTLLRVGHTGRWEHWEPFNPEQDGKRRISRRLYKNVLGNKLCFEEINHDLGLEFRYTWSVSDAYGFVRSCVLTNRGTTSQNVEFLDGLQNILPAGTPRFTQTNSSNLVDAYKWTELDEQTGLALFTLYSGITDRAEPCESLKANIAFSLGLESPVTLISSEQIMAFRRGQAIETERHKRGMRCAFMVSQQIELAPGAARSWQIVTNTELGQASVVALRRELREPSRLADAINESVVDGSDQLARIMAMNDGLQLTAEENVTVHHYANVMFNVLRGGYFPDHYWVNTEDFKKTVAHFNVQAAGRNEQLLNDLPAKIRFSELLERVKSSGDHQLARLCHEYLPITFGRRHGDPSRPWNQFAIRLKDRYGRPLYWYEGNWRDIFQNWEALALSYPEFAENMIAKFVNASTMDGYNPYRITKAGIDWEVEDPEDPWSYIGYWGDHQIIYLQKLLEHTRHFHPRRLGELLQEPVFAYANVPYRIRPFTALLENPKSTVVYDDKLAERIDRRVAEMGADGKLVLDRSGEVYQVTLLEKLLVPLLSKLGNLVVDGGIWMNTQRPEWNDANNAIVGQGLSMVTLYYLRRYVRFLTELLNTAGEAIELSLEVSEWLTNSAATLRDFSAVLEAGAIDGARRLELLTRLGEAASEYREQIYGANGMRGKQQLPTEAVSNLLRDVLATVDYSLAHNRREDGLYHAYNLLNRGPDGIEIATLYPMLEGQVSVLSAGALDAAEAIAVVEALFESDIYRADQKSFMLYPDRPLKSFLQKNIVPSHEIDSIPLLRRLVEDGNEQIIIKDADGCCRFSAEFRNAGDLDAELDAIADRYGREVSDARAPLHRLFEEVFDHRAFTGRSGTMFGFEGLGCIYWHMVSKLLLAVQENFFAASDRGDDPVLTTALGRLYYQVRAGLGFNKTPAKYGAFPTDPYSHTPREGGARQPGMTGQVKEEILARFGELGVRVSDGVVRFDPGLLRGQEFIADPQPFRYLDVEGNWQTLMVPAGGLAFTWCQVPVIYQLIDEGRPSVTVTQVDGSQERGNDHTLSKEARTALFRRDGKVRQLTVTFDRQALLEQ